MVSVLLQVWGGGFYLLNKIFFSAAERSKTKSKLWKTRSWIVYLLGLPAWVVIFIGERNWMAAAVEGGGAAAMILGLWVSIRGKNQTPKWLDGIALAAAVLGIGYSLYDFGGLNTINQGLELGVVIGFLVGTYLLAKLKPMGYLFFMLMNISNASLMFIQDYKWLALQQMISLAFVMDAFLSQKRVDPASRV